MLIDKLIEELSNNHAMNYSNKQAENLARKVLEATGYDSIVSPTPIVKIAEDFGFKCFSVNNMPDDIEGNIFVGGNTKQIYNHDKVIVVGKEEAYEHQRFIVAHELAHYLIDYLGSEESKNNSILFSMTYKKRNNNYKNDVRADKFATELLMPSELFKKMYIKASIRSHGNENYIVSYLSTFFKTKKTSVIRRIDEVTI